MLRGRRSECALLDELLTPIGEGESRTLLLRGEAGVGKRALLEYLAGTAADLRVVPRARRAGDAIRLLAVTDQGVTS